VSQKPDTKLENLCINTIRMLSADAVQNANSGHPGLPMGAAAMAYTLWTQFLKHNPHNPKWFDRDRFILSAGHGSMLLYSLLFLTGYDLPLDQLKRFRQWGSMTPGHPERLETPGVEVTTGPLGQGVANSVGFAIAEAWLAARYNRPGHRIVGHYTYVLCGDGDLMEGVSQEAGSLAGHLKLGKLIGLYDQNRITLAGGIDIDFTEDVAKRFEAYGWHTRTVLDGNDTEDVARAIQEAQAEEERPSMILVHTSRTTSHRMAAPSGKKSSKHPRLHWAGLPWKSFTFRKTQSIIFARRLPRVLRLRTRGRRSSTRIGKTFRRKPPSWKCW
jgi:transketolase